MQEVSPSPTRLRVYRLAVDGKAPDAGLSITSISEQMVREGTEISRQAVEQHIKGLIRDRYISQMKGTRRPALYIRGERASILDGLLGNTLRNPLHQGGVNVQNCGQQDIITTTYVPSAETHIDGRYIFPVTRQGDMSPLKIGDERVRIFEREPKTMNNGVLRYSGLVPLDDEDIKIEFWEGTTTLAMHVWPKPVELLPGRSAESRDDLTEKAQRVVNILAKFGGWKFGIPRFVGDYHYATNDPAIVGNFKDGVQLAKETNCWLDGTPPPKAFESTDAERMDAVINFHAITEGIKADVAGNAERMDSYEASMARAERRIIDNSRMLAEVVEIQHRILQVNHIEMQRQAVLASQHMAEATEKDSGVMYS